MKFIAKTYLALLIPILSVSSALAQGDQQQDKTPPKDKTPVVNPQKKNDQEQQKREEEKRREQDRKKPQ